MSVLSPVHTGDNVEFNTVNSVESRLLPKLATNRQRSRLSPIRSTRVRSRNDTFQQKSTVLNSTLSPVCTGLYVSEKNIHKSWGPLASLQVFKII